MDDVAHDVVTEIAADGAWFCLGGVGRPDDDTSAIDGIIGLKDEGHDISGRHEGFDFVEEWFEGEVLVVFLDEGEGEGEGFGVSDGEAGVFEARDDRADEAFADAVGFEEDERFLGFCGEGGGQW